MKAQSIVQIGIKTREDCASRSSRRLEIRRTASLPPRFGDRPASRGSRGINDYRRMAKLVTMKKKLVPGLARV
jgi:hypothetical protein